jgi:hypothetical protein
MDYFLYYFYCGIPHNFELLFLGKVEVYCLDITAVSVGDGGNFPEILLALVLSGTIITSDRCCSLHVCPQGYACSAYEYSQDIHYERCDLSFFL